MQPRHSSIEREVLQTLIAAGVAGLSASAVVWSKRARHDTALVTSPAGGSWFVKRCGRPLGKRPVSLGDEARFYRLADAGRLAPALGAALPRLVCSATDDSYLILEGLPGHADLRSRAISGPDAVERELVWLGRVLGALHATRDPDLLASFGRAENPVVTHGRCTPETIAHGPQALGQVLRGLQRSPAVNERLRDLRASWRVDTLAHGDAKLDNVLVPSDGDEGGRRLLVDWELVGLGDGRWDCGSVIGSYLLASIERWHDRSRGREAIAADAASAPRAIGSFWAAYAAARAGDPDFDAEREENDAFAWAGYWLLHRTMLMLPARRQPGTMEFAALHLAVQLLTDGDGAETSRAMTSLAAAE